MNPYIFVLNQNDFNEALSNGGITMSGAISFEPFTYKATWVIPEEDVTAIKVTMQPGAEFTMERSGTHDEGSWASYLNIESDGELWHREDSRRSSDCDGPHESHYESDSDGLPYEPIDGSDYKPEFPWRSRDIGSRSYQRDVYAESMGY